MLHSEALWLQRQVGFIDGNQFRKRPDAAIARPGIDLVTHLEAMDLRSDPSDYSGHVVPQDERRAIRKEGLEGSIADFGIQRIEPGGVDLDQNIVIPQRWLRHVAEAQGAVLLVFIEDECLHDDLFSRFLPTPPPVGEPLSQTAHKGRGRTKVRRRKYQWPLAAANAG